MNDNILDEVLHIITDADSYLEEENQTGFIIQAYAAVESILRLYLIRSTNDDALLPEKDLSFEKMICACEAMNVFSQNQINEIKLIKAARNTIVHQTGDIELLERKDFYKIAGAFKDLLIWANDNVDNSIFNLLDNQCTALKRTQEHIFVYNAIKPEAVSKVGPAIAGTVALGVAVATLPIIGPAMALPMLLSGCVSFFHKSKLSRKMFKGFNTFDAKVNSTKINSAEASLCLSDKIEATDVVDLQAFDEVQNTLSISDQTIRLQCIEESDKKTIITLLEQIIKNQEYLMDSVNVANAKLDVIEAQINSLLSEFESLKQMKMKDEAKLVLLYEKLDELSVKKDEVERYIEIVKKWLSHPWPCLNDNSKVYLPSAEYLYDNLKQFSDGDMSPFVLQYCRAIETEMNVKIFIPYVCYLKNHDEKISVRFRKEYNERSCEGNKFVFSLVRFIDRRETPISFELGTMIQILTYTQKQNDFGPDSVFSSFRAYLTNLFREADVDLLLNTEFLNKMRRINRDYRNKAAHSNIITLEKAVLGRSEIRNVINGILGFVPQHSSPISADK